MKSRYYLYLIVFAFLSACKPEIDEFQPSQGNADFSSYAALGNSLTAGFADGALYTSGQTYAYPNILSEKFKDVGGGDFNTPFFPEPQSLAAENGVGQSANGLSTKLTVGYATDCNGETSLAPVLANPNATQEELANLLFTPVASQGPFNNLGVPGAKVIHLLAPGYGNPNGNPFYGRFASDPNSSSVLSELEFINPTFFTLWIGNNDVLGFATTGGIGDVVTPTGEFQTTYQQLVGSILTSYPGISGALANIPDVTSIPFFTTVPYNPIELPLNIADTLNEAYAPYNAAMEQLGLDYRISFTAGFNALVVMDPEMPDPIPEMFKFRQLEEGELVLLTLPQDSLKCNEWGTRTAVPAQYYLSLTDINLIEEAISSYNATIETTANENNLAYVDINALLDKASSGGIIQDGITFTTSFITGNTFSTDGIHLTPQGNAMVANEFIKAINSKYNANISRVLVSNYPPIPLP